MRREDWAFVETLHFLIDATPTDIRLDKLNDVDTDSSSGTSSEMVDLGEQDPLIRRIAKAKEVQVSFLGPKRRDHYLLTAEDLENFRRMITLYEWPQLPAAKNGHPPLSQQPPPSTTAPKSSSESQGPT